MPIYPTVMVAAETIGTFLGCKSTHIFLNNKEISEFSVIISLFLVISSLRANVMALNAMQHDGYRWLRYLENFTGLFALDGFE